MGLDRDGPDVARTEVLVLVTSLVTASGAALLHVWIFVLEAFRWQHPRTRAVFGTTAEEAAVTATLAYNQGVYNLMLAVTTAVGVGLLVGDRTAPGVALVVAGCGSMVVAAVALVLRSPGLWRAALVQGALPALALVTLALH